MFQLTVPLIKSEGLRVLTADNSFNKEKIKIKICSFLCSFLDIFWKRRDRRSLIYNIAYDLDDTFLHFCLILNITVFLCFFHLFFYRAFYSSVFFVVSTWYKAYRCAKLVSSTGERWSVLLLTILTFKQMFSHFTICHLQNIYSV